MNRIISIDLTDEQIKLLKPISKRVLAASRKQRKGVAIAQIMFSEDNRYGYLLCDFINHEKSSKIINIINK